MVLFIKKNFGFIVTSIWIVGILLLWILGDLKKPTSLNELGDFLAGAFAPIAFLWLVLGYKQQGKQLEQNTKALEQQEKALQLQIDEMRESINQQSEMLILNRNNLNSLYEKERPKITYTVPGAYRHEGGAYSLFMRIYNEGKGDCYNYQVELLTICSPKFFRDYLKVRSAKNVSLMVMSEVPLESKFNESLANDIWNGETITLKIKIIYESIYAEVFEEIMEVEFPLFKNEASFFQYYKDDD